MWVAKQISRGLPVHSLLLERRVLKTIHKDCVPRFAELIG